MRHSFILNESGLKWGDTRGNNSFPWPNCTSPFITPTVKPELLALKCCCQLWLQGVPKVTPKLVHNSCKTVLLLENEIWDAHEDLCTTMLNVRSPNFRGIHLHYPHEESAWAANWETLLMCSPRRASRRASRASSAMGANASSGSLWHSEAKLKPHAIPPISLAKTRGHSKFI